jgi:hypothetical protein
MKYLGKQSSSYTEEQDTEKLIKVTIVAQSYFQK